MKQSYRRRLDKLMSQIATQRYPLLCEGLPGWLEWKRQRPALADPLADYTGDGSDLEVELWWIWEGRRRRQLSQSGWRRDPG